MKKIIVPADILLSLLAVDIIFIDLLFIAIPKWISLVSILALLGLIVSEWMKEKRIWRKCFFSILNTFVILFVFVGTYCNPYRNSITMYINKDYYCKEYGTELTYKEAKSDLDEAMRNLRNVHPMFIHGFTPEVQKLYSQALNNLQKMESISINDLSKEIEIIFSSLGDGHTHIGANYSDYHYLKYIHEHNLADDKVVAVNGYTIEEIFEANCNSFSYETKEYGLSRYVELYIQTIEDLDYLGFDVNDGITYTY